MSGTMSHQTVTGRYSPTMEPELPPSTEMATPTPLGTATASPTTRQLQPVLLYSFKRRLDEGSRRFDNHGEGPY